MVDSNGAFNSFVWDFVEYQKLKKFFAQNNPKNNMNESFNSNIPVLRLNSIFPIDPASSKVIMNIFSDLAHFRPFEI